MATAANVITAARYDLRASTGQSFADAELLEYINRTMIVLDGTLLSMDSDWLHQSAVSSSLTAGLQKVTMPTRCISIRSIWITDIIDSFTDLTYAAAADTIATAAGTFVTNGQAVNQTIGITGSTNNDTSDIGLLTIKSVTETLITVNEDVIVDEGTADASGTIMSFKSNDVIKESTDGIFLDRRLDDTTGRPTEWGWEGTNIVFDRKTDQAYGLLFHYNQKSATLTTGTTMPYNDEFNEIVRGGTVLIGKETRDESSSVTFSLEQYVKNAVMTKADRRKYIPQSLPRLRF